MPNTYCIEITNFTKWQRSTSKPRSWVALSRSLFSDPKVLALLSQYTDGLNCFLWLLINADSQGELHLSESALKAGWKIATGSQSNRFDFLNRLKTLSNVGLIAFKTPLEPLQTRSLTSSLHTYNTYKDKTASAAPSIEAKNDPVWGDGLTLLTRNGTSESQARSFLGGLIKQHGKERITEALQQAMEKQPVEPKAYLLGILKQHVPIHQSTEQEAEQQRKLWFRYRYALSENGEHLLTADYEPAPSPWLVSHVSTSEPIDIRQWQPVDELPEEACRG